MRKAKIIAGIIILTALVMGSYFFLWPYYKDWQVEKQNNKFLFGSVSTQLPIESNQENPLASTSQEPNYLSHPTGSYPEIRFKVIVKGGQIKIKKIK